MLEDDIKEKMTKANNIVEGRRGIGPKLCEKMLKVNVKCADNRIKKLNC
jgi:hypothetical protein